MILSRLLMVSSLMLCSAAHAQNTQMMQEGVNFGNTISPKNAGQIINPSSAAPAWSSSAIPGSVPQGMGSFSKPIDGTAALTQAKTIGLAGLGNAAMDRCANYVPTGNPEADQECAAVNFMSQRCLTPNAGQSAIINSTGGPTGATVGGTFCNGSYGSGANKFDFSSQVKETDSVFDLIKQSQTNAETTTGQICQQKSVVVKPAEYEENVCFKSQDSNTETCSQYSNIVINTTLAEAIKNVSCSEGVQNGDYCQYNTSGAAKPVYACPAGQTLSGTTCVQTTTTNATPNYTCPAGSTLSGSNCISQNNVSTPAAIASYSCPAGQSLSGSNCIQTTVTNATLANYSCPAGQTLSGSTCVQTSISTTSATSTFSCPNGYSLSGSTCIRQETQPATPVYSCPSGAVLSGTSCSMTSSNPATTTQQCPSGFTPNYGGNPNHCYAREFCPASTYNGYLVIQIWVTQIREVGSWWNCVVQSQTNYSCPSGYFLSGTSCIQTTTTTATISSYACPSGYPANGSTCTTTQTSNATISYSCPQGGTLSGTTCIQTTTVTSPATPVYSCPAGATLTGTSCVSTTSTNATPNYTCPAGSTLSGSNCISQNNVSTPAAIASYTCPAGQTLSGSSCILTTTTSASIASYTCPAGATLQGDKCITLTQVPATITYSCLDGSAPTNGRCTYKSAAITWASTCKALEDSANLVLGTP